MSVATARQLDDLPIMDELDAPDWGVDFSWVTDDLFARDYQGLMRSSWGDLVAYRNADVEALVAHPQVSTRVGRSKSNHFAHRGLRTILVWLGSGAEARSSFARRITRP